MEMDLAVNSKEEMGKCKEKNVTKVFCINVNIVQAMAPFSSTTQLFCSVFVMSVISETLDDGTVRIKLHYWNARSIFPCFIQRRKRI
jgi:hypothetical protein